MNRTFFGITNEEYHNMTTGERFEFNNAANDYLEKKYKEMVETKDIDERCDKDDMYWILVELYDEVVA